MHSAVSEYVAGVLDLVPIPYRAVVEFGSKDINGSVRSLFGECRYTGVDISPGPGVDVVADAAGYTPDHRPDVVVCCEVLEHSPDWRMIVSSAARILRSGGLFIVTCAGPGREPHSGIDEQPIRDHEHYANVEPESLRRQMEACFTYCEVRQVGADVQGFGVK